MDWDKRENRLKGAHTASKTTTNLAHGAHHGYVPRGRNILPIQPYCPNISKQWDNRTGQRM